MIENPNVICNECGFCKQNKILEQQLMIAVEGLERFSECEDWNDPDFYIDKKEIADLADDYLKQIKELNK